MAGDLPGAVLYACSHNAIRSPMAAAIMRQLYGHRVFVGSCGVKAGEEDLFVETVMDEIGIKMGKHCPQSFDDLDDTNFDMVISLSPEAHHRALEMTRTQAIEAEYWPTLDPSAVAGSRAQILDAYRDVRDGLYMRIRKRFGPLVAGGV
jgi:protein-tyrosine-phosphatase